MKNRIYLQGFENGMPFIPSCKEVIYAPFAGNQVLDDFFRRNLAKVKKLFKERLEYEFIYIPDVVRKYSDLQTLKYYHPLTDAPTEDTIRYVETKLLNKHLHHDNGEVLNPGLVHFMLMENFREAIGEHKGCYEFSYFPLSAGNDKGIMNAIRDYVEHCGEKYCHINYGRGDYGLASNADSSFYRAQDKYFKNYANRNLYGIKRYIVDSLCDSQMQLSKMEILEQGEIFLTDFNIRIDMCDPVRAIYLLFLRHPEGIVLGNLHDYVEELQQICEQIGMLEEVGYKWLAMCLIPDFDVVGQLCGEIYSKFREHMDDKMAANYIIQAAPYNFGNGRREPYLQHCAPKKIVLDRSLVSWHEDFKSL